jgi:hypothetical protein
MAALTMAIDGLCRRGRVIALRHRTLARPQATNVRGIAAASGEVSYRLGRLRLMLSLLRLG